MQFLGNYLSKAVEVWIQVDAVMISKGDKSISDVGLRDSIKQAYSERMKFEMQFNEYKGIFECHKVRKAEPRSEGKSVDINEDGMFVHAIPSNLSQETLYDRVMQYLSRRNDVEDIVGSVDKTSVFGKFKMYWSVPSNIFTKGTATSLLLINCYEDKLVISCKDWEVIATEGSGFLSVHGKMKYNSIPKMNSVGKKDNQKDKFIESTTKEINHLVNSLIEQIEK